MGTENNNPFAMPGFGQAGDTAHNPLMASMDMMRRAWQGMAGAGGQEAAAMATPMSVEDLERRISDLRAVENWLRLNLSMLSSTIQGLEVQRSTISTLMSFAANAAAAGASTAGAGTSGAKSPTPSPLEAVLGIVPGADPTAASTEAMNQAASAVQQGAEQAAQAASTYASSADTAVKGWWDMLQKQFDTLAAATTSSMQNADPAHQTAPASADSSLGKKPAKSSPKKAAKATKATKTARKRPVGKV